MHPSIGNGFFCTGPPCPADHNNTATNAGPWPVDSVMLFDLEVRPRRDLAVTSPSAAHRPPCRARTATSPRPTSPCLTAFQADPTESHNLAAAHPDVVSELTALIKQFNASAADSRGVCAPAAPEQAPAKHNGTCTPWLL